MGPLARPSPLRIATAAGIGKPLRPNPNIHRPIRIPSLPSCIPLGMLASMDKAEYTSLRQELERRRELRRAEVEAEYLADASALDKVWALCESIGAAAGDGEKADALFDVPEPVRPPVVRPRPVSRTPTALIRETLPLMGPNFTNPDVRKRIEQHFHLTVNSKEIASVLNKMKKSGAIRLVREGNPNQPAVYSLAGVSVPMK